MLEKESDIPLYLQDFFDMTYVMQKTVLPRYNQLLKWNIHYSRHPQFTKIDKEYRYIVDTILGEHAKFLLFYMRGTKTNNERKAVYFICHSIERMTYFHPLNIYNLLHPNYIDLTPFSGLPSMREKKAVQLLKKIFALDKSGYLIYTPEIIQQNYFTVFRDKRGWLNVASDGNDIDEM